RQVTNFGFRRQGGWAHASFAGNNARPALIDCQWGSAHLVGSVVVCDPAKEIMQGIVVASFLGSQDAIPRSRWLHRGVQDHAVSVLWVQGSVRRAQEGSVA